jgi:2-polyprenyl-6-methoxyphenol hydroxylase-like FAD-dependent oxidoreductase
MSDSFDVIVVGARCAGSPLATLLARAGLRVCLLDRARFPSDTPSTHGIQPSGVKLLGRLGVLEPVTKAAAAVEHGRLAFDDVRVEVRDIRGLLGAPMLNARRITLDAILLEAAAAAGAEVRTQTAVTGLIEEGGRVVGVRSGDALLRAPLVVGADGARSTVARLVGATEYHRTPPGRAFLWGYFEDVPSDSGVWLGRVSGNAYLASPTDAGLTLAAVAPPIDRWGELRGDREAAYAAALRGWPELHAALDGGRRVGPLQAMPHWHGFFRTSAGPGWVLVGDAGHFKDPTPGQGIADALRQAFALAPAIERALGGAGDGDQVLRDWCAWRDRDAWEMYWFAHDSGMPGPTPLIQREVERRIAADPRLVNRLMRVFNHELAPSKLVPPSLALGALASTLRESRGRRRLLLRELGALATDELRRQARAPWRRPVARRLGLSR